VQSGRPDAAYLNMLVDNWKTTLGTLRIRRRFAIQHGQRHTVDGLAIQTGSEAPPIVTPSPAAGLAPVVDLTCRPGPRGRHANTEKKRAPPKKRVRQRTSGAFDDAAGPAGVNLNARDTSAVAANPIPVPGPGRLLRKPTVLVHIKTHGNQRTPRKSKNDIKNEQLTYFQKLAKTINPRRKVEKTVSILRIATEIVFL
jgi:hypothetical protein